MSVHRRTFSDDLLEQLSNLQRSLLSDVSFLERVCNSLQNASELDPNSSNSEVSAIWRHPLPRLTSQGPQDPKPSLPIPLPVKASRDDERLDIDAGNSTDADSDTQTPRLDDMRMSCKTTSTNVLELQAAIADWESHSDGEQPNNFSFQLHRVWNEMPPSEHSDIRQSISKRQSASFAQLDELEATPPSRGCNRFVSRPTSRWRILWNTISVLLILFDVVMIPLLVFDMKSSPTTEFFGMLAQGFWIADLIANFSVGYYKHGELVMDAVAVRKHYLRNWFLVDVTIVTTDWVLFLLGQGEESSGGSYRVTRVTRAVKFVRVYRLLRLKRISAVFLEVQEQLFSETASMQYSLLKICFILAFLNHFGACFWYAVGNTDVATCWVNRLGIQNKTIEHRYFVSLHWSVGQMGVGTIAVTPVTMQEYVFAFVWQVVSLMSLIGIVSTMTNLLSGLQQIDFEKKQQLRLLRKFCADRHISTDLSHRIHSCLRYSFQRRLRFIAESDVDILNMLSTPLRQELHYERFAPSMKQMPIFEALQCASLQLSRTVQMMQKIAREAIGTMILAREDVLFQRGDLADHCYYKEDGVVVYKLPKEALRLDTGDSDWLSEAVLWCPWVHMGKFRAVIECHIIALRQDVATNVMASYPDTWEIARSHAEGFVQMLNGIDRMEMSDFISSRTALDKDRNSALGLKWLMKRS